MHEVGLVAKGAADLLVRATDHHIGAIRVAVGPRADRLTVQSAWDLLTRDTPLESARVTFEDVLDDMVCFGCATAYRGDELTTCPSCGGDGIARELAPDVAVEEATSVSR